MPLTIVIENERRTSRISEFYDIQNVLTQLPIRAQKAGKSLKILGYVDAYGDTTLNSLQQEAAIVDVDELNEIANSLIEREILSKFKASLVTAMEQQYYVRIIGD
jgi:hypothetical protein